MTSLRTLILFSISETAITFRDLRYQKGFHLQRDCHLPPPPPPKGFPPPKGLPPRKGLEVPPPNGFGPEPPPIPPFMFLNMSPIIPAPPPVSPKGFSPAPPNGFPPPAPPKGLDPTWSSVSDLFFRGPMSSDVRTSILDVPFLVVYTHPLYPPLSEPINCSRCQGSPKLRLLKKISC